jgi:hypothetical protein
MDIQMSIIRNDFVGAKHAQGQNVSFMTMTRLLVV